MRFVIIASARTGSSHLVNMLGAHPEILCNGNVFHPHQVWVFWPEADLDRSIRDELKVLREKDPVALLERVFATDLGRPHVGFKIFEGQNNEILDRVIHDGTVKKVVLYRKNVLANFSSKLAARKSTKFGAREGETVAKAPSVRFVRDRFIEFHDEYVAFYRGAIARLNACGQPFHLVDYDEINDPALFSALVNFIGADPTIEPSKLEQQQRKKQVKQNSSDICSRFSNPADVLDFLRENGLLHWAHEGETSMEPMGGSWSSGEGSSGSLDHDSEFAPDATKMES